MPPILQMRGNMVLAETAFGVADLVTRFGMLGILAWFLWYRTAVADPARERKLTDAFDAISARHSERYAELQCRSHEIHVQCESTISDLHQENKEALNRIIVDYKEQAAEERKSHVADFTLLAESIKSLEGKS